MSRWIWLKLAVSIGLILLLVHHVDSSRLFQWIAIADYKLAALAVVVLSLQLWVAALRWGQVAQIFTATLSQLTLWRYCLVAQCFSQLLPSSVGADAIRIWLLYREGMAVRSAVLCTLCDRLWGVGALLLMVVTVMATPAVEKIAENQRLILVLLVSAGLAALIGVLVLGFLPRAWFERTRVLRIARELSDSMRVACELRRLVRIGPASVLIHGCSIVAIWLLAKAISLDVDVVVLGGMTVIALFAATLPISIAGWGVREGVLVALLRSSGIAPEGALALSLLFGVALVIASLPGAFVWFFKRADEGIVGKVEHVYESW